MSDAEMRPLRADARRNRDRLLEVGLRAFSHGGPEVTLEAIAAEALIEAAYRSELTRLCASVSGLLETMPAVVALRTWMDRFIDYLATKRGMADALHAVIASGSNPFAQSRESLLDAVGHLLHAGVEVGDLRDDIGPADVMAGLSGVSLVAGAPDQRDQAGRLLDLLLDGLCFRPSASRNETRSR
jgi:hypothetical protein